MDSSQQRDFSEEEANRHQLHHEGLAELTDLTDGDPRSPEWHQQRAVEAIGEDLLDLAHAHLYLAAELSNAISTRAARFRAERDLSGYLRANPAHADRIIRALEERTVQVPHLGVTRDEQPGTPATWRGTRAPSRHLQPVHGRDRGPRPCTTCGGGCGYFDTPNHVGWWHLGGDGEPIEMPDQHQPTLEG